ncbi:hypothetical protein HZB02_06810 [Candidatus Woesearchaeota archaeon]|nr:hypothetical protein [Candidatus Woesearchaeota archaeon]
MVFNTFKRFAASMACTLAGTLALGTSGCALESAPKANVTQNGTSSSSADSLEHLLQNIGAETKNILDLHNQQEESQRQINEQLTADREIQHQIQVLDPSYGFDHRASDADHDLFMPSPPTVEPYFRMSGSRFPPQGTDDLFNELVWKPHHEYRQVLHESRAGNGSYLVQMSMVAERGAFGKDNPLVVITHVTPPLENGAYQLETELFYDRGSDGFTPGRKDVYALISGTGKKVKDLRTGTEINAVDMSDSYGVEVNSPQVVRFSSVKEYVRDPKLNENVDAQLFRWKVNAHYFRALRMVDATLTDFVAKEKNYLDHVLPPLMEQHRQTLAGLKQKYGSGQ